MRVHPRIHERHPEISGEDVRTAWENYAVACSYDQLERELRVDFDGSARQLEMIGILTGGEWLVYHAMTPPTRKFLKEIERETRRL